MAIGDKIVKEEGLDEVNHIMELIRTIFPIILLIMQCIILWKIG